MSHRPQGELNRSEESSSNDFLPRWPSLNQMMQRHLEPTCSSTLNTATRYRLPDLKPI